MRSLKSMGPNRGQTNGSKNYIFLRALKFALVPVIIVYLFLQMIITAQTAGIRFEIRRRSLGRKYFQNNQTFPSFVTIPSNDSVPEDVYVKLRRVSVTPRSKTVESTCSSHVRLLRGYQRQTEGFLTLGLSTVPREGAFYLPKALESLVSKMTDTDKSDVVIVLFLGAYNTSWLNMTLTMLDTQFADSVSSGLIQVVQPDPSIYPDFKTITKRNFNDTLTRVHWRTKQNIDYAYLFAYCERLSKYYMHIEDDITAANGYINEIRTFVAKTDLSKQTWFLIEFSSLGFIGKLFRSSDMCTMKDYFLLFKDEKPCDLLINDLKHIKTQVRDIRSPKSLFQHFGISSSLKGKLQKLTDKNFKDAPKKSVKTGNLPEKELSMNFKTRTLMNPAADVFTSMIAYEKYTAVRPYIARMGGFFWAKSPSVKDYYTILFRLPINITQIHIRTGHPIKKLDILEHADVKAGHHTNKKRCEDDIHLGSFKNGTFTSNLNHTLTSISCIEIILTESQSSWMIMYEINVLTPETGKSVYRTLLKQKKDASVNDMANSGKAKPASH